MWEGKPELPGRVRTPAGVCTRLSQPCVVGKLSPLYGEQQVGLFRWSLELMR